MAIDEDWFENERMHRAAAEGDVREMSRLCAAGHQLDRFDDLGRAPLHYAVEGEHYKAAEWLIQQGASVNSHDEATIGETPLGLAAQRDYPEMAELLLKSGADPDIRGWMANTARTRAARRKDEDARRSPSSSKGIDLGERHVPSSSLTGQERSPSDGCFPAIHQPV